MVTKIKIMSGEQERILVKTIDNKNFHVDLKFLNCCKSVDNPKTNGSINVEYNSDVLAKAIEFLDLHEFFSNPDSSLKIPKPLLHSRIELFISDKDYRFISELEDSMIIDLIRFSKTYGVEQLYELLCAYLACLTRDLTCNKIASLYNGEKEVFDQIEESLRAEYIEKLNGTSEK